MLPFFLQLLRVSPKIDTKKQISFIFLPSQGFILWSSILICPFKPIPMKFRSRALTTRLIEEKKSARLLMEKMGLDEKELEEISYQYGVSAAQLLELMQYSKYQFIITDSKPGNCQPCQQQPAYLNPVKF